MVDMIFDVLLGLSIFAGMAVCIFVYFLVCTLIVYKIQRYFKYTKGYKSFSKLSAWILCNSLIAFAVFIFWVIGHGALRR